MIDQILLIIFLGYLIFAVISDLKTREVPNWLNYSLIIIGLSLKSINTLLGFETLSYFLYSLLGFGIFFGIANLMYYAKQWGGGDAKLLMGMGVILATYPKFLLQFFSPSLDLPFLLTLFINILIFGAIYGIVYSAGLAIKNRKKFSKEFKKLLEKKSILISRRIILIFCIVLIISVLLLLKDFQAKALFSLLGLFLIVVFYLFIFIKAVEASCMFKQLPVRKLTPGDWVTEEIKINKKVIYNPKSLGIEEKQINLLKKSKIKKVLVKEGIPFTPTFLIGVIISLIFGNLLFFWI